MHQKDEEEKLESRPQKKREKTIFQPQASNDWDPTTIKDSPTSQSTKQTQINQSSPQSMISGRSVKLALWRMPEKRGGWLRTGSSQLMHLDTRYSCKDADCNNQSHKTAATSITFLFRTIRKRVSHRKISNCFLLYIFSRWTLNCRMAASHQNIFSFPFQSTTDYRMRFMKNPKNRQPPSKNSDRMPAQCSHNP